MKKQYWAVGLTFNYDILACKPRSEDWGSTDGPFATLGEAKKAVKEWIENDRNELSRQLDGINKITLKNFGKR